MSRLVKTTSDFLKGVKVSKEPSSGGVRDGEPGLPKRTHSGNAVSEVTRDGATPQRKA